VRDFLALCDNLGLRVEACAALTEGRSARTMDPARGLENWRAEAALFLLSRRQPLTMSEAAPLSLSDDLFGQ
jgi:hypothetical protein